MSTIDTDGFLSDEAEQGRQSVLNSYADAFSEARKLNQTAMALLSDLDVDWNHNVKPIITSLFVRIIETYQSVILLLERGMVTQARMLVRTLLDALFSMAAISRHPELVNSYYAQHYNSVISALKAAERWKQKELRGPLTQQKITELIALNKEKLEAIPAKRLNVLQWAEKAELSDFYNIFYVENSSAVHSDMWALNDHVYSTPNQGLQIHFGPSDVGLYHTLRSCATALLNAMDALGKVYSIPAPDNIRKAQDMWEQLDVSFYKSEQKDEDT